MKPLHFAIALSVVLASITMPALQARAVDEDVQPPSTAWKKGFSAGQKCITDGPDKCTFTNEYPYKPDDPDVNTTARDNSDYIAGFIAGKATTYDGK
jgi:hypothetical protein